MKHVLFGGVALMALTACEIVPTPTGEETVKIGKTQANTSSTPEMAYTSEAAISGDTAVAAAIEAEEATEGEGGDGDEGEAGEGLSEDCDVPAGGVLLSTIARQLGCS